MAWTPLDEGRTSADSIPNHVADHNQLHAWGNLAHGSVFNVKDYGAVGDGVTDDTAALAACKAAADAAGRGTVFLPVGTFMTDGLSLSATDVNIQGSGINSILKGNTGITGAVLSLVGWQGPPSNLGGHGFFRDFAIEGDGVADATKTHYGLFTAGSGFMVQNVGIQNTGGPGWYATSGWGCEYKSITVGRPVGADTNDVPYVHFVGWFNGNTYDQIMFRSVTTDPDGSSVWLIEDDGAISSTFSTVRGTVVEFCHTPEGGAILDFAVNGWNIELPQFFDCSTTSDNQTTSCHVRMSDATVGSAGANYLWGQIPGDGAALRNYPFGVELVQDRNFVHGTRGYNGRNVHLALGCGYSSVLVGGRYSGVASAIPSVVDDSGETTNKWVDLATGDINVGALESSSTTVGFYGATPVAKQTGVAVSAAGVHAALVSLGLIT